MGESEVVEILGAWEGRARRGKQNEPKKSWIYEGLVERRPRPARQHQEKTSFPNLGIIWFRPTKSAILAKFSAKCPNGAKTG